MLAVLVCCLVGLIWLTPVTPTVSDGNLVPRFHFNLGEQDCPEANNVIPEIFYSSNTVPLGVPLRAACTNPPQFEIRRSSVPGAGLGVFATTFVRGNTWLAEYEGEYRNPIDIEGFLDYAWEVTADDDTAFYIDGEDARASNWLRYINGARHVSEENVLMSQCYERIYYRTKHDIAPGTELFVDYGKSYADKLGVDYNLFDNPRYTPATVMMKKMDKETERLIESVNESERIRLKMDRPLPGH